KGERASQAALREVEEETGYRCRILHELPKSNYWFRWEGQLVRKTVRWFLMEPVAKTGEHDHEVETATWVSLDEAHARLTHPSDRDLVHLVQRGACGGPERPTLRRGKVGARPRRREPGGLAPLSALGPDAPRDCRNEAQERGNATGSKR
ncbi:MAG: NUDIX domain-containing protein, partial [Chloroflexi bacterium]|nr:NUDIX domain-containing protein [Chloroflexota bacterium]